VSMDATVRIFVSFIPLVSRIYCARS
jgi:hypothetical protein